MIPRSFVSPRHKSRGDPKFRTGLQSEQAIVREGGERPVTKVHLFIYSFSQRTSKLRVTRARIAVSTNGRGAACGCITW